MKNILENTPKSWHEITFKTYLQTLSIKEMSNTLTEEKQILFNIDRSIELLAILNNTTAKEVGKLPPNVVTTAISKLAFLAEEVPHTAIQHKVKKVEEVSYQNFIEYINLSRSENVINNLPKILTLFFKDLTEDEVLNLDAQYVFSCFFFLSKQQRKYLKSSIFKTAIQVWKLHLKAVLMKLKFWKKRS